MSSDSLTQGCLTNHPKTWRLKPPPSYAYRVSGLGIQAGNSENGLSLLQLLDQLMSREDAYFWGSWDHLESFSYAPYLGWDDLKAGTCWGCSPEHPQGASLSMWPSRLGGWLPRDQQETAWMFITYLQKSDNITSVTLCWSKQLRVCPDSWGWDVDSTS